MSDNIRISNQIFYKDELYHHGVLGMKWGKRLFRRKKSSVARNKRLKKNSYKNMTDKELDNAIIRLRKEQMYKELVNSKPSKNNNNNNSNNNAGGNKNDGFARKFISKSKDATIDAVTIAAKNAGQAYLEKKLKDKLGLNTKSEHDRLKEQSDIATFKANIARQKAAEEAAQNAERAAYKQKVDDFMRSYYSNSASSFLGLPGPGAYNTHHRRSN